jgi:hypothetical protein
MCISNSLLKLQKHNFFTNISLFSTLDGFEEMCDCGCEGVVNCFSKQGKSLCRHQGESQKCFDFFASLARGVNVGAPTVSVAPDGHQGISFGKTSCYFENGISLKNLMFGM